MTSACFFWKYEKNTQIPQLISHLSVIELDFTCLMSLTFCYTEKWVIRRYSITWQAMKLKCYVALIKETKQQQWSGYYKYLLERIQQFILFRSELLFPSVPPLASTEHRSDRRHIHSTLVPQSCYNILATYGLWKCLCFSNRLQNNEKTWKKRLRWFSVANHGKFWRTVGSTLKSSLGEWQKEYLRGPNLC